MNELDGLSVIYPDRMYTPAFHAITDEAEIRALVAAARVGWLVTVAENGYPAATFLPIIWRDRTVVAHLSRANPQWRETRDGARCLVICTGPQAYISPSWYATKQEHGRVVPTWNYSAVHISGTIHLHEEPEWLRAAVTDLTSVHERDRGNPWQVQDAPEDYVNGQLRGIVGIEVQVEKVEGKAKLSQNRSLVDRRGVIEGLRGDHFDGARGVAAAMEREL